ncbi:hypothetical protein CYMTET_55211 [Cymbomonas tetramitiformis]|uniref:Uncharacterized protein n=1 Tax=Cymbomonas tetramitiformis TaxID=36881 RepID=A0AAE0BDY2_9CHLO|nr:hypothetical protein CYMTET_55211 [Cymbomonas tetramitiformis]
MDANYQYVTFWHSGTLVKFVKKYALDHTNRITLFKQDHVCLFDKLQNKDTTELDSFVCLHALLRYDSFLGDDNFTKESENHLLRQWLRINFTPMELCEIRLWLVSEVVSLCFVDTSTDAEDYCIPAMHNRNKVHLMVLDANAREDLYMSVALAYAHLRVLRFGITHTMRYQDIARLASLTKLTHVQLFQTSDTLDVRDAASWKVLFNRLCRNWTSLVHYDLRVEVAEESLLVEKILISVPLKLTSVALDGKRNVITSIA